MIRAYVGDHHRNWDQNIAQLGFALRSSVHESTGYTPNLLVFGRELTVAGSGFDVLQSEDQLSSVGDCKEYSDKLKELQAIHREVSEKLKEVHRTNARHYNLRRRPQTYRINSLVWKKNFTQSDAVNFISAKLTPRFVGPYVICTKDFSFGLQSTRSSWKVNRKLACSRP
ncbi:uncharacterized protein LOC124365392 [Homalodisca vitripennis]|uniref:uncharacterized protein LOC124365392 n=1 Tax=Homalodisca vitripennis TaxID=197043 RepID=UPI001EE9E8BE|nr:uncharacterized protein LOC124365392 [Homalodisca vitripennis]